VERGAIIDATRKIGTPAASPARVRFVGDATGSGIGGGGRRRAQSI
jgi:hypothetical protein